MLSCAKLLLFMQHIIGSSETHNAFVKDKAKLSVVVISVIPVQKLQNDNLPPHYPSPEKQTDKYKYKNTGLTK